MASTAAPQRIHPVILAGGSGVRLWPLSRPWQPKPFVPLVGERTLFQLTAARLGNNRLFAPPLIVCNRTHRFLAVDQLAEIGLAPQAVLLEPVGRNTAAAACVAALFLAERDPDALLLLAPSDHFIGDEAGLLAAIARVAAAAVEGWIVTFGATPDRAETGYGYIRQGEALAHDAGCFRIAEFVEKPDAATAQRYVASGSYVWNSGMFLASASRLIAEMERHEPAIVEGCRDALRQGVADDRFHRLDAAAFARQPGLPFDKAVMERTDRGAVIPIDVAWSDVGSWNALHQIADKDADGNVLRGPAVAVDSRNTYLYSDTLTIAAFGLDDIAVIATKDALLVCPRSRSQELARLVDRLAEHPRYETLVRRPASDAED